jgi:glycosyltransferase involved in cell wall biosynthesis
MTTTISVIIATRNRPGLFAVALQSVVKQTIPAAEIIVVDDGSDEMHRDAYSRALTQAGDSVRHHLLVSRPKGHGQSYALNFGVAHATSDYVAFLDDDDCWLDAAHLERASHVLAASKPRVDVYMTNQAAFANGERRAGPIWIEELGDLLRSERRQPVVSGAYAVSVDDLLRCTGFCHLNTLIVRRRFYEDLGGMDEGIRWECDRDLVLRLMDQASEMRYSPEFVARHNIPDPKAQSSMTTSLSDVDRRLYQIRVLDRAILFARHRTIRRYARRHKTYALKRIAEALATAGRAEEAAFYAREGLGAGPNLKWVAYTSWRMFRSLASKKRQLD